MITLPTRVTIYVKDVTNITGRSERTGRKLLALIRKANGKPPHAFVTVEEFCAFTGIREEAVRPFLQY
ncbi:hypothetical protein [Pseudocnuella soli]|jgi:hypothetical protein|uniref:hypothetical protein n=1 Tax=Pseudocnuella soli TaxID=2502779 RepID=UPI0010442353|nr:hypothetical protein [Pseudocnuella soli]